MDLDLNDVAVFNEVVAAGGFTAAGQRLGLPPSAVSRRITRLEKRLGFKLLNRTTRSVGLTDAGRVYHQHTAGITEQLELAARAVHNTRERPTGLIRVTAPPDDGGLIWRLISGFIRAHPQVDIEIIHTLDYVDLIEERIDVALRGGKPPDSTVFTAHELFNSRLLLVASPAYLALRGTPERAQDLNDHDCIAMDTWAPNAIRALDGDRGPVRLKLRNRVRVNRLTTAQDAAVAGFGIAPLLKLTCQRELAAGQLVEVLRGALPSEAKFWAVYPAGRKVSVATQALIEHMIKVAPEISGEAERLTAAAQLVETTVG